MRETEKASRRCYRPTAVTLQLVVFAIGCGSQFEPLTAERNAASNDYVEVLDAQTHDHRIDVYPGLGGHCRDFEQRAGGEGLRQAHRDRRPGGVEDCQGSAARNTDAALVLAV